MYGRNRGNRTQQDRGYYMPGKGPKSGSGPGIRERDMGPKAPSRGEANDYCQHFVDTGQRPQNFLRDVHLVGMHSTPHPAPGLRTTPADVRTCCLCSSQDTGL